jgi:hypothetical protein
MAEKPLRLYWAYEDFRMSALLPFLALNQNHEQAQAWVKEKLTGSGFRVVPTFDLQVARSAQHECTCPHHGTDECSCQLVVLLVYGKNADPATLVIHAQDGKTWISMATPAETGSRQNLESSIRHILIHRYTDTLLSAEASYGTQPTA